MDIRVNKDSNSLIFKMSIPIFIELFLQLLVGNIDQIMISRYSIDSVGSVGNANQILNIIILILSVMTVSTTVLVSRYLGSGNKEKIKEVFNISIYMIILLSIILTTFIFLFDDTILRWLKVPDVIYGETSLYVLICSSLIIVQGLYMVYAAVLRSYTLMKDVMIVSLIMNIINIIGNALLINGMFFFPKLGIIGAAISTNISRILGLFIIYHIFKKKAYSPFSFEYLKSLPIFTVKNILNISVPSGAEQLSYQLSQVFVMKFTNLFGTAVITTKVYCSMLANIAFIYTIALSQATQIFISYLIGANFLKRVASRVWITVFISILISVSITFCFYLSSDKILGLFTKEETILKLAKQILFVEIFLEIGRSINIVMTKCLVAVEDPKFPAVMCVIFAWLIGVGAGYIFGVKLGYGLVGIWIAMTVDESIRGLIFIFRFKYLKWWKRVHIKKQQERYIAQY